MIRRALLAVIALAALAGCGSTVPPSQRTAIGSRDLEGVPGEQAHGPSTSVGTDDAVVAQGATRSNPAAAVRGPAVTTAKAAATAQTGPISIGFLNTKAGNAGSLGLNLGETYAPRVVFEALVKAMNAKGGIGGRKITPVIADTDTASVSWEADYQRACSTFTQDNKVAAVVGYSFGLFEAFESCLAKAGVPHLSGGYAVGDTQTFQQYPYFVGTTHPTSDRRLVVQLEGPLKTGILTPAHRLGLLLDDCPEQVRAYSRSVEAFIKRAKLTIAATAIMNCGHGVSDATGIAAQIQNAALQFRSRNVDTVVTEGVPLVIFAQQAESQGWRPRYLVTSTAGGAAVGPNAPAAQAANMFGVGWFPAVDVTPGHQPPPTRAQQRCLDMLKQSGIVPTQYNDFIGAYTACDGLFLYEAAVNAAKGATDARSVTAAVVALGSSYQSASTLDGKVAFGQHRDGPSEYRPFGWDGGCSCFVYKGPAVAWP